MVRAPVPALCVLALAASSLLAAGCGDGPRSDRDQARDVVAELYAAVDRDDGTAACARMTPALRSQIADDAGTSCAKGVLDLDLQGRAPRAVRVYADAGEVVLAGGDTVFLGITPAGWRVAALGCSPAGQGPYDCEAEA
jgi:hypothetical protein